MRYFYPFLTLTLLTIFTLISPSSIAQEASTNTTTIQDGHPSPSGGMSLQGKLPALEADHPAFSQESPRDPAEYTLTPFMALLRSGQASDIYSSLADIPAEHPVKSTSASFRRVQPGRPTK